jgi:hypothetical protein
MPRSVSVTVFYAVTLSCAGQLLLLTVLLMEQHNWCLCRCFSCCVHALAMSAVHSSCCWAGAITFVTLTLSVEAKSRQVHVVSAA